MERSRSRTGAYLFSAALVPLLLLVGATSTGSQSISMIGYDLSKATGGSSDPGKVAGKVLLLDNAAQSQGIIFAFSVLVGNTSPFTLQLYHFDQQTYRLGQEFTITPSVQKGREDIYIESLLNRRCVVVRPGDRLGLYATSNTPAVQFKFKDASSQLLLCTQKDGTLTCETTYPYDIQAAAYYIVSNDSSPSSSSSDLVDCPLGTLIPGSRELTTTVATTTAPMITGIPGVMGATGMQGATGSTGFLGVVGLTGSRGSTGELGPLGHTGVNGDYGATGWTGTRGVIGVMGATGTEGRSETGDRGVPGSRGPPGPMGNNFTVFLNQPAPRNQAAQMSDESSDTTDPFWSSSRAIWATYLWMAIVSFLLLIVVIVIIVIVCIHRSFSAPLGSAPATVAESRTNIMDDDAPSNYSDLGTVEH